MIDPAWLAELRAAVAERMTIEGEQAGAEFRKEANSQRLANLVDKGETFRRVVSHPILLAAVEAVLGPDWKLSSLNYRAAEPHSNSAQPLHCDMGLVKDEKGFSVFNSIWMLDDFTPDNGPTRAVPGSHHSGQLPPPSHPDEKIILGQAGDVILMNSHCWHGGTDNHTDHPRRSLHGFFVRGDHPQQQYQKRLLRPETIAQLSPELRRILALDDPRNDALSAEGSGKSGFLR
jgi:ectoine hydroxylase-related dioxygenase (phytanoyl-CoA dioxygenase family)